MKNPKVFCKHYVDCLRGEIIARDIFNRPIEYHNCDKCSAYSPIEIHELVKYRIEIWQWHTIYETFSSNNIAEVIEWYKTNWQYVYDCGNCSFTVYENDRELSFEEELKLGFYK